MKKRILSLLLVLIMVLGMLPMSAMADEAEYVYLSISFDGKYINDKDGTPIVYLPISLDDIASVDLKQYGLDNMLFDADGDGKYETTALQLLIYAHENLYGGNWSEVNFYALPGQSYFAGGIFGFTENLVYFHNGDFPVDETQQSGFMTVGATSDRIVLEAGDFIDVASFSCYSFLWDQLGGFHLFADQDGNYVHDYTAAKDEALSVKLMHSFCDLMFGQSWIKEAANYEVYYGTTFGEAEGSVFTDDSGCAEITFSNAGTYYIWCDGGHSEDYGTHGFCDYCLETGEPCIVSAPAYAKVTVAGEEEPGQSECEEHSYENGKCTECGAECESEQIRAPQDVSTVLNATLAKLAETVPEPAFGTNYGEWTVFSLARGNYYAKDSKYFTDYYTRILGYVFLTAEKVNMSGALDKNKSTDNSRLIMALSSIGIDSTSVGEWDLVEAYSANGFNWIKKQGLNGTIWTLIALDSGDYETSDSTIRQQCVDALVEAQHNDGGWSLVAAKAQPSNVDITGMALTALYPYRDQPEVAEVCAEAIAWLSESQLDNGGFPYGNGETSESCVWAIVACTTWGINPDTDFRFIKNGNSAIDNLLTYYLEDKAQFEHGRGGGANAMATDQAAYALVAYDRFVKGENALYDMSDVVIEKSDEQVKSVETVTLNITELTLVVDGTAELKATVFPEDATIKTVKWKSDNTKVARVANGKVTAKGEGTAIITVTTDDGSITATCTVTVIAKETAENLEAANAVKALIAAIGEVTLESEEKITAARAAYDALTDAQKALVDNLDILEAAEAGLDELKAEAAIKKVESVTLNSAQLSIEVGNVVTLIASVYPTDATNNTVIWNTSDAAVATVSSSGVVAGISKGTATITATADGKTASCTVTVTKTEPSGGGGDNIPEEPKEETITVTMRLIGAELAAQDVDLSETKYLPNYVTWIPTTTYTLEKGATVYDLWVAATDDADILSIGADKNYVETVYSPIGGYELSEFTNGYRSGWMYTINGSHPGFGLCEQALSDGDVVIWHYVNDYAWEVEDWSAIGGSSWPQESTSANNYWNRWLMAPNVFGGMGGGINESGDSDNPGVSNEPELSNNPFTDVGMEAYYFDAVLWAVDEGITNGTSATTFSPDASCTRAQMVTFLWRAAGSPKVTATTCAFADVDKDAYYYEALLWAVENGITNGASATTFSPDATCTRGQMATFLYRNAKSPAVTGTHAFADVKADAYYNDAVIWAAAEGITMGTSNITFNPDADCTRGQMVTLLYRYLAK